MQTTTPVEFDTEAWERDGYCVSRGVVTAAELDELRAETDRLSELILSDVERYSQGRYVPRDEEREGYEVAPATGPAANQLRMIEPLVDLSFVFRELSRSEAVTAPARGALGEEVRLFEDKLNLKPPGGSGFTWHQDWSCCWRAHTDELVTCLLYLDDSTEENGCLEVIPGSHEGRAVRPFVEGSKYEVAITADDERQVLPLPLAAGDMITFDPYLLHFSKPNRSSGPRRAILYTYNPARLGDIWSARYPELAAGTDA
jgi:ectoine hydroxylase-related dioxygenase (phytanoyl-CoA dioxygenase family)